MTFKCESTTICCKVDCLQVNSLTKPALRHIQQALVGEYHVRMQTKLRCQRIAQLYQAGIEFRLFRNSIDVQFSDYQYTELQTLATHTTKFIMQLKKPHRSKYTPSHLWLVITSTYMNRILITFGRTM